MEPQPSQGNWMPRHRGKTQAAFEELQAWCARMDAIGPTPRLVVDRNWHAGTWGCFEAEPGGPVVRMHPEDVQRLHSWLDSVTPLVWS